MRWHEIIKESDTTTSGNVAISNSLLGGGTIVRRPPIETIVVQPKKKYKNSVNKGHDSDTK